MTKLIDEDSWTFAAFLVFVLAPFLVCWGLAFLMLLGFEAVWKRGTA
jgi:hypothetical protein